MHRSKRPSRNPELTRPRRGLATSLSPKFLCASSGITATARQKPPVVASAALRAGGGRSYVGGLDQSRNRFRARPTRKQGDGLCGYRSRESPTAVPARGEAVEPRQGAARPIPPPRPAACPARGAAGLLALLLAALPAAAQDATWNNPATVAGPVPGTFDFNANANWTPAAVPTVTAFFDVSSTPNLSFSGPPRHADADGHQHIFGRYHRQCRHAARERLDRQFGGDGEFGRHARGHRHGGRNHNQQRRHLRAWNFARHDDRARQSRLPIGRALSGAGQSVDRVEHQRDGRRQRLARRHSEAAFAAGSYVSRTYTILSAAGGLNGTHVRRAGHHQPPRRLSPPILSYTATNSS